jgi:uncharacterized protein YsxB (DUF464 family)
MINITVHHEKGHMKIEAKGHALYNEGNDIVCAAVSAIIQTAVLGLAEIARQYPENVKISKKEE